MDAAGSQDQHHPSGSYFTPLLISMAGIACTVIALVTYHLLLVRYCIRRNRAAAVASLSESLPSNGRHSSGGVEQKILFKIPILPYSPKDSGKSTSEHNNNNAFRVDQSECVICLGELEEGDIVRLLPNCRHAFHVPCIDVWFSRHSNCPVCRSTIDETNILPVDVVLPVGGDDDSDQIRNEETQSLNNDEESRGRSNGEIDTEESSSGSTSQQEVESGGVTIRHSWSSALPAGELERRRLREAELLRSLSLDERYVVINVANQSKTASSNPSLNDAVLSEIRSYRSRSLRQLDRVSSRLARSFSQLMVGRSSESTSNRILPYP